MHAVPVNPIRYGWSRGLNPAGNPALAFGLNPSGTITVGCPALAAMPALLLPGEEQCIKVVARHGFIDAVRGGKEDVPVAVGSPPRTIGDQIHLIGDVQVFRSG